MQFNLSRAFAYDIGELQDPFLKLRDSAFNSKRWRKEFNVSNLSDYFGVAEVSKEWIEGNCPRVTVREVDRENTRDDVFNEPGSGKLIFSRSLLIHAFVTYQSPNVKNKDVGPEHEQPMKVNFSTLSLLEKNWMPQPGDVMLYLGRQIGLESSYIDVECIHANTGLPTFISCDASYLRYGDRRTPDRLTQ